MKIFLVDDQDNDQQFFEDALREIDRSVLVAAFSYGILFLEQIRSCDKRFAALFLDLQRPLMDGEDCLKNRSKDKKYERYPIIVNSAIFIMEVFQHLFELGANRYLQKQSSYVVLQSALAHFIASMQNNPKGSKCY